SRPSESLGNTSTATRPSVRAATSSANFSEPLCHEFCSFARWPSFSVTSAAAWARPMKGAASTAVPARAANWRRFSLVMVSSGLTDSGGKDFRMRAGDLGHVDQQLAQMAAHRGLGLRGVAGAQPLHDGLVLGDQLAGVEGARRDM